MTEHQPHISLNSVTLTIAGRTILDSVSIDLYKGALTHIVGPSGSGKSTFLQMIAGLIQPDSGSISIAGEVVYDQSTSTPPYERGVSLLFQDLALWPHTKAVDQLGLVLNPTKDTTAEVTSDQIKRMCQQIGFPLDKLDKYPSQLSGGEQQRLALARTFIAPVNIFLLDEPFTALDADNRATLQTYIHTLKETTNSTLVLVSHDLLSLDLPIDRRLQLHEGKLFEQNNR